MKSEDETFILWGMFYNCNTYTIDIICLNFALNITARDKNGCGLRSSSKFVIDYPLFFTPNGDGNNETWNIEGVGSSAKIYIFDRYGKLLKQLSPDGDGWDGRFNGEAMPTDGYWFTVEYDEPSTGERKEFKAHFTLKR
ncbi:T9SS type B sorting domain-containing protein [Winogradskyella wichelsiae]|uniref:T9SS type B sorting domain-containing protein n=1 Tax=Winogradskyella wichelsiae TaxID=2697007 RepID=UPI003EF717AC